MKISNANFTYELPHQHVTDIALPPVSSQSKGKVSIMLYSLCRDKSFLLTLKMFYGRLGWGVCVCVLACVRVRVTIPCELRANSIAPWSLMTSL
jgi:hypothetical protein